MLAKKRMFILLVFIGMVASLVVCEAVLRLFKMVPVRVENESIFPGMLGDYKPSQELWSDYILPHYIKINSLGLRGNEISAVKPNGVFRILILGDSYAYGARASNNQTFPFLLQAMLDRAKAGADKKIEVINAAHSAYSTREEYEYLSERGISFNPDMVILAWFPNDIRELSREYSWRDLLKSHYKFEPWKSYIRSLALFNSLRIYISYAFIKLKFGPYVPKEEVDILDSHDTVFENKLWGKCFDYLLKAKDFCNNKKIDFLLVALVDPEQIKPKSNYPQQKLKVFAEDNVMEFIDTSEDFLRSADSSSYYLLPKDCHFSAKGSTVVAGKITGYLKTRGVR